MRYRRDRMGTVVLIFEFFPAFVMIASAVVVVALYLANRGAR